MFKRKVLITGGAGFIGSHLARRCVKEGYEVNILALPSSDPSRIKDILADVRIHTGDLADRARLEKIFQEIKPTGVFHLATSTLMSGVTAPAEEVIRTNILGTVNLLNAVSDLSLDFFVNTGTFTEYAPQNRALKESDPTAPPEIYSISKLASTLYTQALSRTKNLPAVTLRLFTPYGPAIQPGRLVYNIIAHALANQEISLTLPTITRDFIFVEDIVDLFLGVAKKARAQKGEIFNMGTGVETTLRELVGLVLEITGSESRVAWGSRAPVAYDASPWQADMTKTFKTFDWRPRHSLANGLDQTIAWYKNNMTLFAATKT